MLDTRQTVWRDWAEWSVVFEFFRSDDPSERRKGVQRVNTWRTRGKVPVAVCATASLVEATLLDTADCPMVSQWSLRQLYSMSLIRLINSLVDTAQKGQYAQSVASLLCQLRWPSWLGNLRHEATHGALPSIEMLRLGAQTALTELCERYWLAQQSATVDHCAEDKMIDKRQLQRLLTQLFADPSQTEGVQECVDFCEEQEHNALTLVTAVIDRTVQSGNFDALDALCSNSCPLSTNVQAALEQIQKPLRDRLFSSSTTSPHLFAPFCRLFVQLDIDAKEWKTLEQVVRGPKKRPKATSASSTNDVQKEAEILAVSKRRKTQSCRTHIPWTPVGTSWSWKVGDYTFVPSASSKSPPVPHSNMPKERSEDIPRGEKRPLTKQEIPRRKEAEGGGDEQDEIASEISFDEDVDDPEERITPITRTIPAPDANFFKDLLPF